MHNLEHLLRERISSGLKRKSITKCSEWSLSYRVMGQPFPGPWSFKYHPWIKEMHDADEEMIVGQKGAQLAFTECVLNKAFFNIDVKGVSVLYVLPAATPDASDFSKARFDPALELSPHLSKLFSHVKNIGHKRAGSANLYIRGSRSRSQLKSIPVGFIILDEVDEMQQANVPLAFERAAGQRTKQVFMVSTPTIDLYGINEYFQRSTQDHFFFNCPNCGVFTQLVFPECLVITADSIVDPGISGTFIKCKECEHQLDHETKHEWLKNGVWVPEFSNRNIRGFHISQLYSSTVKPADLAASYLRAQTNPADEQEFWNSKLGLPHVVEGARVTQININNCKSEIKKVEESPPGSFVTMGVDVGKWLHYEIDQWFFDDTKITTDINLVSTCRLLTEGKVQNFDDLDILMGQFRVGFCVIDANPERRKALEFAQRFYGRVKLCFYARGINTKVIHLHPDEECTFNVDRTSWLDLSLGRIRRGAIKIPQDISHEYENHLKALVRIYKKDADDNAIGIYVKGNEEDHFAHARNYAEMALPLGASLVHSYNITGIL